MNLFSTYVRAAPFGVAIFLLACGSGGASNPAGDVGTYGGDGVFGGADASSPNALDAYIEQGTMQVKLITLSCAEGCATVQAVPVGGNPPYTFAWEDGSTSATREVCPTSSTHYTVTVTDAGATGELARPRQTAQTSVTADIPACPDGGSLGAGGALCVSNPSFEGTAVNPCFFSPLNAAPWTVCGSAADQACIVDRAGGGIPGAPAPTDGTTYLLLALPYTPLGNQFVSEPLCSPLVAGTSYSMRIDLDAFPTSSGDGGPPQPSELQIWGGSSSCSQADLLWTSPPLPVGAGWKTYCATFTPSQGAQDLALGAIFAPGTAATSGSSILAVDHIVPVAACP